ncbi:Trimeric GatFAB AmidoTransferase(AdT) complex subunit [Savitreella phatthalungensis]
MRVTSRCLQAISHAPGTSAATKSPPFDPYNALIQLIDIPQSPCSGALASIRFSAKANICTKQGLTTCGSQILSPQAGPVAYSGYNAPEDATCVSLLSRAGASLTSKSNMDEFGMGSFSIASHHGPVISPIDLQVNRSAGGSSGGAAVSVLLEDDHPGCADIALGTDTGGSVRLPAAYTNTVGFKPSYGRISRTGVVAYANSLDTVGLITRPHPTSFGLLRTAFSILDVHDPRDPTSLPSTLRATLRANHVTRQSDRPLKVGIPREYMIDEIDPSIRASLEHTLQELRLAGCGGREVEFVEVSLPLTRAGLGAYYVVAPAEASSNLSRYSGVFYGARACADRSAPVGGDSRGTLYAPTRGMFGSEVRRRILAGTLALSADKFDNHYLRAARIRRRLCDEFNTVFAQPHPTLAPHPPHQGSIDLLVTPTAPNYPPTIDQARTMQRTEALALDVFTVPASLAGLPACSVPVLSDGDRSLPAGVQVIGQFGDDEMVLDLAQSLTALYHRHSRAR